MNADVPCLMKFKPDFARSLYKTSVEVTGKRLSGILLIKNMPDSSIRVFFSNEMGFSFFDLGFGPENAFQVYQITPQLNKKAVIKTLRKDFELLLFQNMDMHTEYALTDSALIYFAFPQAKGINYYITDVSCEHLIKMQRASNKKPVMEAFIYNRLAGATPDSILIRHLNFNFTVSLKKIPALAPE